MALVAYLVVPVQVGATAAAVDDIVDTECTECSR